MRKMYVTAAVIFAAIQIAGCGPTSVIEDLGTFGGQSSGLGINERGNVVGGSFLTFDFEHLHGFLYVDGLGMIDLGALPGPSNFSEATGINKDSWVVGSSEVEPWVPHAFLATPALAGWPAFSKIDLGALRGAPESYANDINDHGQVTGTSGTFGSSYNAFIWSQRTGMTDLGTLGGTMSSGESINNAGQVAGHSTTRNNITEHAFRFTEGVGLVDLGSLGGGWSRALRDFFDTGHLFLGKYHAFLWTEGVGMVDLGALGGGTSFAGAINNHGAVVGIFWLLNGDPRAFRWTKAQGMIDLNILLPRRSGWVLQSASDINDKGQITGIGLHNGATRAYRLTPEPVPEEPVIGPPT